MRIERNILTYSDEIEQWSRYESTFKPSSCGAPRIQTHRQPAVLNSRDYFARAKVTKNLPDSDGFRSPSAYWSEEILDVGPSGHMTYTEPVIGPDQRYLCPGLDYFWSGRQPVVPNLNSHTFGADLTIAPFNLRTVNSLKFQALSAIKDQEINLSMTLAFAGQSIGMINKSAMALLQTHRDIKSRNWKSIAKRFKISPKSTSSFYLEFLFGWRQLFADAIGAAKELEKSGKKEVSYIYGRARHKVSMPVVASRSPSHWSRPFKHTFQGVRICEQRLVMIAKVEHSVLARKSALGLLNPAELVWDVIPWSWAIDTTISIGQFLGSLDALAGMTYMGGSYTLHRKTVGAVTLTPLGHLTSRTDSKQDGHFSHTRSDRSVVDSSTRVELKNPLSGPIAVTAAVFAALAVTFANEKDAYKSVPKGSVRKVLNPRRRKTRTLAPIPYKK